MEKMSKHLWTGLPTFGLLALISSATHYSKATRIMNTITRVVNFLKTQGCKILNDDDLRSVQFVCPNGITGDIEIDDAGELIETIDGQQTWHDDLKALKKAWK